ncbi:MAG: hypothetical protein U0586_16875 [Candidatus Brocadiaceae bacterium]
MKKLILGGMNIFLTLTISIGLTVFGTTEGWAQQKKKVSYKWTAADAEYTKQYTIDVSDDHQIRIFEIHRTFPKNPPFFECVKVLEEWMRGGSDYIDLNGRWWGHGQYVLENGDKIYYWADGTSQSITNPDGTKKSTTIAVKHLGGGTGKFSTIVGVLRHKATFDPKAGFNKGQCEGEYWIDK